FAVSEGEGLTDADREFMRTGNVPEGFKPPENITPEPVVTKTPETPAAGDPPAVDPPTVTDAGDDGAIEIKSVDKNRKPHGKNGRFVPHQALHAEREEHKKTKGELAELREKFAAGDARLNLLYQLAGVDPGTGKAAPAAQVSPIEEKDIAF